MNIKRGKGAPDFFTRSERGATPTDYLEKETEREELKIKEKLQLAENIQILSLHIQNTKWQNSVFQSDKNLKTFTTIWHRKSSILKPEFLVSFPDLMGVRTKKTCYSNVTRWFVYKRDKLCYTEMIRGKKRAKRTTH